MVKITWSGAAKEDLKEIIKSISRDSPEYAQVLTETFFEKLKLLTIFPKMGRSVSESDDPDDGELDFQHYRIIYNYNKGDVEVITIIQGMGRLNL